MALGGLEESAGGSMSETAFFAILCGLGFWLAIQAHEAFLVAPAIVAGFGALDCIAEHIAQHVVNELKRGRE